MILGFIFFRCYSFIYCDDFMEDERKTKKQLIEELNRLRLEQIEQTRVTSEKFTKAFLQNSLPMTITTVKEGRF
jgi:hypothetical protein